VSATASTTSTTTADSGCIGVRWQTHRTQGCEVDRHPGRRGGANSRLQGADMAEDPAADRQALVEVINLGLLWHCLCAITRLEVPERPATGPLPVPELATAVGADQDALWRVLRLLADHTIVTLEGDRAGLTARGRPRCPTPSHPF